MDDHPREVFANPPRPGKIPELTTVEQRWVNDFPDSVLLKQVGRGGRR